VTAEKFFTHPLGIVVSAAGAAFLWGSALPIIKISYAELGIGAGDVFEQLVFAGYRFAAAGLLIWVMMLMLRKPIGYQKGTGAMLGTIGLFQTLLQYLLLYIGISLSSGIQASVISATTSFFQIAVAHFMFAGDKINGRKLTGLVLGFAGVVAVNIGRGEYALHFGLGEWLTLIAMFFGGLGNVLSKKGAQKMELMYMTSYQMILGGVALFLIGMTQAGAVPFAFSAKTLGMLAYLSFLSAAAFVLWNVVMKYNKVGKVSMYLFLIPVSGVLLSSLLLGETIGFTVLLALALVGAGIVIVNREGRSGASTGPVIAGQQGKGSVTE